jgi:hypothetical protein
VGSYAISKATYTYGSNYSETYAGANLVIGQRAVSIIANAASKYCGQIDPAFTFVSNPVVGFTLPNGEVINFTGSLSRASGQTVSGSPYEIQQGTLTNSNYSISYTSANFTINGVTIDASASSNPVQLGNPAILSATAQDGTMSINAVSLAFVVTNGAGLIVHTGAASTGPDGIATITVPATALPLGLYQVKVGNGCSESIAYLPVYDPNSSFITGGGWINSPMGALVNTTTTGKANFGFVAKYKKGSNAVEGNTEFQFQAGDFNFKSNLLDAGTLIISGAKATYRGVGTVNGSGNYGFMVSAIDGAINGGGGTDKFRIKIWDKASGNAVVYDNQIGSAENADATTVLGGGSIVIHEVKGGKQSSTTPLAGTSPGLDMKLVEPVFEQKIKLGAYPNPFAKQATIAFTFPTDEQMVALDVYDLKGSKIKRIYEGKAGANQTLEFEFNGSDLSPGMYLLRLTSPKKVENFKMIMTE